MKIIEAVVGWVDEHLDVIGALLTALCAVALVCGLIIAYQASMKDVRVYCVTSNNRPEVLYDGIARVISRDPYVRLIDRATGRQVILVNATCRISEKDPE
jgi:hypothetical protein